MLRWTIAGVIVIGLLAGIWLLWPRDEEGSSPTTVPVAAETTTTSERTTTTELTTTTVDPTEVREVETVEQAEAILRELMYGWFEGIHQQDVARIREVVITEQQIESAEASFGTEFERSPRRSDMSFGSTEVLRADGDCLVLWTVMRLEGFREGEARNVHVMRWVDDRWQMLSSWLYRDDLWEADCESALPAS